MTAFAASLRDRTETAYRAGPYALGWRLLASPADVLEGADTAFIGLNPGGNELPDDHAEFCMEQGSAYCTECWDNKRAGESNLQRQVRQLFAMLGAEPEKVLAANLVPFRSPDWDRLDNKPSALAFGKSIWREILDRACPRLVITMGTVTGDALVELLGINDVQKVPVGWGKVSAKTGRTDQHELVCLPHLSRFRLFGRQESKASLGTLFKM